MTDTIKAMAVASAIVLAAWSAAANAANRYSFEMRLKEYTADCDVMYIHEQFERGVAVAWRPASTPAELVLIRPGSPPLKVQAVGWDPGAGIARPSEGNPQADAHGNSLSKIKQIWRQIELLAAASADKYERWAVVARTSDPAPTFLVLAWNNDGDGVISLAPSGAPSSLKIAAAADLVALRNQLVRLPDTATHVAIGARGAAWLRDDEFGWLIAPEWKAIEPLLKKNSGGTGEGVFSVAKLLAIAAAAPDALEANLPPARIVNLVAGDSAPTKPRQDPILWLLVP